MQGRAVDPRPSRTSFDVIGLDRFNAFTDGVYAIAITLLVLELTVPTGSESLLTALAEQWQEFLGYLISFAFIGGSWLTHARMTKLMRCADSPAAGINLLILLLIAVLPFTTSLMVTHLSGPDMGTAVFIYGLNVLLASLALSALLLYLGRERSILADDIHDDVLAGMVRSRWLAIVVNLVALAVAMAVPLAAVGLYLVVTLIVLLTPLVRLRRRAS